MREAWLIKYRPAVESVIPWDFLIDMSKQSLIGNWRLRGAKGNYATDRVRDIMGMNITSPIQQAVSIEVLITCDISFLNTKRVPLQIFVGSRFPSKNNVDLLAQFMERGFKTLLDTEPPLVDLQWCQLACKFEGFLVGISTFLHWFWQHWYFWEQIFSSYTTNSGFQNC